MACGLRLAAVRPRLALPGEQQIERQTDYHARQKYNHRQQHGPVPCFLILPLFHFVYAVFLARSTVQSDAR